MHAEGASGEADDAHNAGRPPPPHEHLDENFQALAEHLLHDRRLVSRLVASINPPPLNAPIPDSVRLGAVLKQQRGGGPVFRAGQGPFEVSQGVKYTLQAHLTARLDAPTFVHFCLVFHDGHLADVMTPHSLLVKMTPEGDKMTLLCEVVFSRAQRSPLRLVARCPGNPHCVASFDQFVVVSQGGRRPSPYQRDASRPAPPNPAE